MNRRNVLINKLAQAIACQNLTACSEYCFRILYGLPLERQVTLCCVMMQRYIGIFKTRYPNIQWPEEIVHAPDILVHSFDYIVPDEPEGMGPADSAFIFAFDALCDAYSHRKNQAVMTSACSSAINSAISARVNNVWHADDPEAIELWRNGRIPEERTVLRNVASVAVEEREWKEVLAWFQKTEIWHEPDDVNVQKMEHALEQWIDSEMTLINPENSLEA